MTDRLGRIHTDARSAHQVSLARGRRRDHERLGDRVLARLLVLKKEGVDVGHFQGFGSVVVNVHHGGVAEGARLLLILVPRRGGRRGEHQKKNAAFHGHLHAVSRCTGLANWGTSATRRHRNTGSSEGSPWGDSNL